MPIITITVRRTSVYEVDVPDRVLHGDDEVAIAAAIFDAIGGDEIDGTTDFVGAWDETGKQVY